MFREISLEGREAEIARDLVAELKSRLDFLNEVGLSYLALDRSAPTLSGGEAQRIRLAAQLGSNLRGVCYILDEPTIGLHPRDNRILLDTLEKLQAKGNTLIVVEHDEDTIRRAEHVIDLGPGAGKRGGEVIAARHRPPNSWRIPTSITGRFLAHPLKHPLHPPRAGQQAQRPRSTIAGASLHNLEERQRARPARAADRRHRRVGLGQIDARARCALRESAQRLGEHNKKKTPALVGCRDIRGWRAGRPRARSRPDADRQDAALVPGDLCRVLGRRYAGSSPTRAKRACAATPRAASRSTPRAGAARAAKARASRRIEMSFLPDVKVLCEVCNGARFNPETLAVRFKRQNDRRRARDERRRGGRLLHRASVDPSCLRLLQDVGLGYLTLGQQSPTLSGGEAQRIKLVTELAKVRRTDDAGARRAVPAHKHTLYVLDEPTVGLHMADVEKLIRVLHRLVDAGNTVVVIEHNLDVMAEADWIIDLGPEGGDGGGRIVAQGSPRDIIATSSRRTPRACWRSFWRSAARDAPVSEFRDRSRHSAGGARARERRSSCDRRR